MYLVKCMSYLINLSCLIVGVGILLITFQVENQFSELTDFISMKHTITGLMVVGVGLLAVTIIGLCGVLSNSRGLLILFSTLLTIFLIGEIVLFTVTYQNRYGYEENATDEMKRKSLLVNENSTLTDVLPWDTMHSKLKCCGIHGPNDWAEYVGQPSKKTLLKVIKCCSEDVVDTNSSCPEDKSYKEGCLDKLKSLIHDESLWFYFVTIVSVQFVAACLSFVQLYYLSEDYGNV